MQDFIEIYTVISGSRAYGTSTPQSDTDIRGIAFPRPDSMFGLHPFESQVLKDPDKTVYSFNRFITLAMQANPNIMELLWIDDPNNILFECAWSARLKAIRGEFLTQKAYKAYVGYAKAQLHKIKVDGNCSPEMNSKRKSSIDANGYDVKAGMHLYRLLCQMRHIEIARKIPMPLSGGELILCKKIRSGNMPFPRFKTLIDEMFAVVEILEAHSSLPVDVDRDKIIDFVISMNREFYLGGR